jgi:hypothetical protein
MQEGWAHAVAGQLAGIDLLSDAQVLAALQALRAEQQPWGRASVLTSCS